ncbi:MAG TPA: ATP-binding protein [Desulfobacteria bacterium]|nr:ATP-binding protein [Desulfobacteria bacterium]
MELKGRGRFYHELLKIRQSLKDNRTNNETAVSTLTPPPGKLVRKGIQHATERERFEKELKLSHDLFLKIFQCSPLLMAITTCEDYRCIAVNESFIQCAGYPREEIANRTMEELNIMSEEESLRFQSLIRQGANRNLEFNLRTKAGEMRLAIISTDYIIFNNQQCLLWQMTDATEIKNLQQEMVRLGELNLVGEMAASIGHEIRNPMTTARGFLQMLGCKPECLPYKEYFDLIIEELDRANTIVTEFLSMAQIKSNNFAKLSINQVIETLLPLIKADGLIRDISVETDLGKVPDLPLIEKEIRQLVLNLTRNAMESMTSSGTIKIKTFTEESEVVLSVEDQGIGIKPELVSKLGSPFLTTKENGTGLGLTICFSIASRHNAVINVDTGSNGTTFFIRFKSPLLS